jgi:hypothetical protein
MRLAGDNDGGANPPVLRLMGRERFMVVPVWVLPHGDTTSTADERWRRLRVLGPAAAHQS